MIKKAIVFIIFFILLLSGHNLTGSAAAQTVRVGVYSDTYFCAYGVDGNLHGQNIEYLNKLAEYTGWQYDYVGYNNFYEAFAGLHKGEIDLIGGVFRSEKREQNLAFSEYPSNINTGLIMKSNLNSDLTKDRMRHIREIKIGILRNFFQRSELEEYLKNWNTKMIFREYDNNVAMMQAMSRGEIDLFATVENENVNSFTVFDYYAPTPSYYAVRRSDTALLHQLNEAQRKIKAEQPEFLEQLLYPVDNGQVFLSKSELEYLQSTSRVKIGVPENSWPLSVYDAQTGIFRGSYIDFLHLVEEKLKIKLDFVPVPEAVMTQEFLRHNRDVVGVFGYDMPDRASFMYGGVNISRPIIQNTMQFVGRKDCSYNHNDNVKIALLRDKYSYQRLIKKYFPEYRIIWVSSMKEALEMVDSGEADLTLYNVNVLRRQLSQSNFDNLEILNGYVLTAATVMALPQTGDWQFMSILNKVLASLSYDEVISAVTLNAFNENDNVAMHNVWLKYRIYIIIALSSVGVLVLIFFIRFQRRLAIQKRYRILAELSGAIFFEYNPINKRFYCSDGYEEELGHKIDEKKGILPEWMHSADYPKYRALLNTSCYAIDKRYKIQLRFLDVNNKYIWYEVTSRLLKNGRIVGNMKNIDIVMRDREQYKTLASIDRLTGLLNKATMLERLDKLLQSGVSGAMFFVDMDNFKAVNDKLGHNIGDEALCDIAANLKHIFRDDDLVARFGGDEFFIFVKDFPRVNLDKRGSEICRALCLTYGGLVTVSASVGIAYIEYGSEMSVKDLIERADKAAYISKINGKNCYTVYNDSLLFDGYTGQR